MFSRRASVMKTVQRFLRGPFRNALRVAMEKAVQLNAVWQEGGWRLFILLPRLLLHRPLRGGNVHKSKLAQRFEDFARGHWLDSAVRMLPQHTIARRADMIRLTTFSAGPPGPSLWCKLGSCRQVDKLWRRNSCSMYRGNVARIA